MRLSVRHPIKLPVLPANSFGTHAAVNSCRSCRCAKIFPDYLREGKSHHCCSWFWPRDESECIKRTKKKGLVCLKHTRLRNLSSRARLENAWHWAVPAWGWVRRAAPNSSSEPISAALQQLYFTGVAAMPSQSQVTEDISSAGTQNAAQQTTLTQKIFSCSEKCTSSSMGAKAKWSARSNCTHQTCHWELWSKGYKQPLPWRGSPRCRMLSGHWSILKHLGLELFIYLFILQLYKIGLKCFSLPSIFPQMFQYKL